MRRCSPLAFICASSSIKSRLWHGCLGMNGTDTAQMCIAGAQSDHRQPHDEENDKYGPRHSSLPPIMWSPVISRVWAKRLLCNWLRGSLRPYVHSCFFFSLVRFVISVLFRHIRFQRVDGLA